jgi:excisionase family DNA binding protein
VDDSMTDQTPAAKVSDTTERTTERLLTPGEVASLFRVDPKTVSRWATAGRLSSIRTPGGHHRFFETDVQALLFGGSAEEVPA